MFLNYNALIDEAFSQAIDPETGEILDEEALAIMTGLEMARDEKVESMSLYYKDLVLQAEALKSAIDELAKKRQAVERRADRVKGWVTATLGGEKFSSPTVSVHYRKSKSVRVIDEEMIPDEFCRIKREANRTEIAKAIKGGHEVAGATLVENTSTIIS